MIVFIPFTYIIDLSMMSILSQLFGVLIDLQVYSNHYIYLNSITFKSFHTILYCRNFQLDQMAVFSLIPSM